MFNDQQAFTDFIMAAAVFLLVLSLWIAVVMLWARRRRIRTSKIKDRLGIQLPTRKKKRVLRLWHAGEQASTTVPVTVEARSLLKTIDRYCRKAGWTYGPGPMIALVVGVTALSSVFTTLVTANLWLSAAVGIALLITIRIYLEGRIASRAALFEEERHLFGQRAQLQEPFNVYRIGAEAADTHDRPIQRQRRNDGVDA